MNSAPPHLGPHQHCPLVGEISETNAALTSALIRDARRVGGALVCVESDGELTRGQGPQGLERMYSFTVRQGRESLAGLRELKLWLQGQAGSAP